MGGGRQSRSHSGSGRETVRPAWGIGVEEGEGKGGGKVRRRPEGCIAVRVGGPA